MPSGFKVYVRDDRLYADGMVNSTACSFLIDTGTAGEVRVCESVLDGKTLCRTQSQTLVGVDQVQERDCAQHVCKLFVGNLSAMSLITADPGSDSCILTIDCLDTLLGLDWYIDFNSKFVGSGSLPDHAYPDGTDSPVKALPLARRKDGSIVVSTTVDGNLVDLILDTGCAYPLISFSPRAPTTPETVSVDLGAFQRSGHVTHVKPNPGETCFGVLGCPFFKGTRLYVSRERVYVVATRPR